MSLLKILWLFLAVPVLCNAAQTRNVATKSGGVLTKTGDVTGVLPGVGIVLHSFTVRCRTNKVALAGQRQAPTYRR